MLRYQRLLHSIPKRAYTTTIIDRLLSLDGPGNKHFDRAYKTDWKTESFDQLADSASLNQSKQEVQMSTLENGIRVVSRACQVPGHIQMGLVMNVGTRHETNQTSGALHSIKTTMFKSALHTNETVNYGMVQMSGGSYTMNYDREFAVYNASCMDHDVVDIFSMMTDCALEPRNILAANVAMEKLGHSHKSIRASNKHHDLDDLVMRNVYGDSGLGNSILGNESNISNLTAFMLQKFQIENISPEKIVVTALGVKNHQEFLELVNDRLGDLNYGVHLNEANTSTFREGKFLTPERGNSSDIVVCFESAQWSDVQKVVSSQLLESLLGSVEGGHFESLISPDGVLYRDFYSKNSGVLAVEAFSQHYSDSGIFGLRMSTFAQNNSQNLGSLLETVKRAVNEVSEEDLAMAKKRLKVRVMRAMDNKATKCEEFGRNVMSLGSVVGDQWVQELDTLTTKQWKTTVNAILAGKVNLTGKGSNMEGLLSLEQVKQVFA